jgi:hypothetical protein
MFKFNLPLVPALFIAVFYFSSIYAQAQVVMPDTLNPTNNGTMPAVPLDSLTKPRPAFVIFDSLNYRFIGDGNFSWGNVDRSLVILRAEIASLGPVVSLTTNPRFTYGRQNQVLAERDIYVDLALDVYREKQIYGFGLATIETSNLRGIDFRRLAGLGIGLRLLKTERHNLSLTNAVIDESTNFRERPTVTTHRLSTRLKGKHSFLQDKLRFNHITFVQPSLRDFSNLRWNTLLSVELPLTTWVTIRTSFENSYESVVEANRKRNDSRLTFGLAVGRRP